MSDDGPGVPIPHDRTVRIRHALQTALEGLRLARREVEGAGGDPARQMWAALGLVTSLQAALVAALSGYDTARIEAVQNPSQPDRLAPGSLLLRRARSGEYLNPPERVVLSGRQQRAVARVVAVRNAAVHALGVELPDSFDADLKMTVRLIAHLLLDAPAFDTEKFSMQTIFLREALVDIERCLDLIKPA